jgi:hypothetical protein
MQWTLLKGKYTWVSNRGYRIEGSPVNGYAAFDRDGNTVATCVPRLSSAKERCERNHSRRLRKANDRRRAANV